MKLLFLFLAAFTTVYSEASVGPSFNCTKATTDIEKSICSHSYLAKADFLMAKIYSDSGMSQKSQKEWIQKRNLCPLEGLEKCLSESYLDRIKESLNFAIKEEGEDGFGVEVKKLKISKKNEILVLYNLSRLSGQTATQHYSVGSFDLANYSATEEGVKSWFDNFEPNDSTTLKKEKLVLCSDVFSLSAPSGEQELCQEEAVLSQFAEL